MARAPAGRGWKFLLLIAFAAMLSQLWNVNIIASDDPYISVDAYRQGGILAAGLNQAKVQGRHYYTVSWSLAQVPYLISSTQFLAFVRIASNVLVGITFYRFLKSMFGEKLALLSCFSTVALLQTQGGRYNPFFDTPLWYTTGAAFLFLSLRAFTLSQSQNSSSLLPFVYFFACLHFYESMLFYAPAFVFIHLYFYLQKYDKFELASYAKDAMNSLKYLFLAVLIYLVFYGVFRAFHPSTYEGSQSLSFESIQRSIKTIVLFSVHGIKTTLSVSLGSPASITALVIGGIVSIGTLFAFGTSSTAKRPSRNMSILILVTTVYLILAPNILYGFVKKYHGWVDVNPFYNGSYFSAFALASLFAMIAHFVHNSLSNSLSRVFAICVAGLMGWFAFSNFQGSLGFYEYFRIRSHKWDLVNEMLNHSRAGIQEGDHFCTTELVTSGDPLDPRDYWKLYFSSFLGKKVSFSRQAENSNCRWVIFYQLTNNFARLSLKDSANGNQVFVSQRDFK